MLHQWKRLNLIIALCLVAATFVLGPSNANAHSRVRFRRAGGYLVVAPVSINGLGPFDFVVDTGTNTTLVDIELAAQLKLKPVDEIPLATLTGSEAVPRYLVGSLTLGAQSVAGLQVLAQRMDELHAIDRRVRGVLGLDFLLEFPFVLDYGGQYLEIYDPSEAPSFAGGARVAIEVAESRILVPAASQASVRGQWKLAMDSGISQFLIFDNAIDCSRSCVRNAAGSIQVATNLARLGATTVTVRDLVIADRRMKDVPVVVLRGDSRIQGHFEDGLLPTSFFRWVFISARQKYAILKLN